MGIARLFCRCTPSPYPPSGGGRQSRGRQGYSQPVEKDVALGRAEDGKFFFHARLQGFRSRGHEPTGIDGAHEYHLVGVLFDGFLHIRAALRRVGERTAQASSVRTARQNTRPARSCGSSPRSREERTRSAMRVM